MMVWIAMGLAAETAIFMLAGFSWFISVGYTFAEASAGAIVSVFMALSLIHQIGLYVGSPLPGLIVEAIALAVIVSVGLHRRNNLLQMLSSAVVVVRKEAFTGLTIAATWTVMAAFVGQGWMAADPFLTAAPWTTLMTGSAHGGWVQLSGGDPIAPLNATALFFHTTRFGLEPDACGFGLLAHMVVGFSTYALARRYTWPPMALTVTLMVLSMPRLVFLGLRPSAELISTAAIIYSVVLAYRLVEQHQAGDLRFFLLCLLFSVYANPISMALVAVMLLFLMVVMIRRHGWLMWRELMTTRAHVSGLVLILALVLAQIPVFALNMAHGHPLFGVDITFDQDGIRGAAANMIRYVFIGLDPTEPLQQVLVWLLGLDLNRLLMGGYKTLVAPVVGHAGAQDPFHTIFSGGGQMGFGPFALLLVLPAMIHALVRGPRRLKALMVAWGGYLYLAALVVAWQADSIRVLSPVITANGFVVAFFLPPWRLRRRGMRLLQVVFALLLAWSLAIAARMP